MRLDKFISNSTKTTRSKARIIIKNKKVKVNGILVSDTSMNVDENVDEIYINNEKLSYKEYIYIMLNKPKGVLSASDDKKDKTVVDLLDSKYKVFKLFPIGRLDKDTEGLIILTNDGKLTHRLLSPKKHVYKKYYVEHINILNSNDIKKLENGVDLGDFITKNDAKIETISAYTCYITISEGKFHQIKRMFKAINNEVIYLKRICINKLYLDEKLSLCEYKELSDEDLNLLKDGI